MPRGDAGSLVSRGDGSRPGAVSSGGWCPQLTNLTVPSSGNSASSAVTKSSSLATRDTRASRSAATSTSLLCRNALCRNAPSTAAASCTASIPLPRTSPTISRTPCGVAAKSYRSPPTRAFSEAETYRTAKPTSPISLGIARSTARCAVSAMTVMRRSCFSRRCLLFPMTTANPLIAAHIATRVNASGARRWSHCAAPIAAATASTATSAVRRGVVSVAANERRDGERRDDHDVPRQQQIAEDEQPEHHHGDARPVSLQPLEHRHARHLHLPNRAVVEQCPRVRDVGQETRVSGGVPTGQGPTRPEG